MMVFVELHALPDGPDGPDGDLPLSAASPVAAAVEVTIAALAPPDADAAVVALARLLASTIDGMEGAQLALMLGQTAPQLLKLLVELESRARARRPPDRASRAGKVAAVRAAHAQSPAKRKRMG